MFAVVRTCAILRRVTTPMCASTAATLSATAALTTRSDVMRTYRASASTKKKKLVVVPRTTESHEGAEEAREAAAVATMHGYENHQEWTSFLAGGHAVPTAAAAADVDPSSSAGDHGREHHGAATTTAAAVDTDVAPVMDSAAHRSRTAHRSRAAHHHTAATSHTSEAPRRPSAAAAWKASRSAAAGHAGAAGTGGRMKIKDLRGMVASSVGLGTEPLRVVAQNEAQPLDEAAGVESSAETSSSSSTPPRTTSRAAREAAARANRAARKAAARAAARAERLASAAAAGGGETGYPDPPAGFSYTLDQVAAVADAIVETAVEEAAVRHGAGTPGRRREKSAINGFTLFARDTHIPLNDAAPRWQALSDAQRANYTSRATALMVKQRDSSSASPEGARSWRPCCVSGFGVFIKVSQCHLTDGVSVWGRLSNGDRQYMSQVAAAIRQRVNERAAVQLVPDRVPTHGETEKGDDDV